MKDDYLFNNFEILWSDLLLPLTQVVTIIPAKLEELSGFFHIMAHFYLVLFSTCELFL